MRVGLLGCGLIGGSIGLGLKAADPSIHIVGYDRDADVAARALERGAADEITASPADSVDGCEVVFIATPVGSIPGVAAEAAPGLADRTILTDVGSTKSRVVLEINRELPQVRFIGGHPMAGTEEEGIDASSADLFRDAWWVLTPTERSDAEDYRRLHGLIATLGARVLALDPLEHDRLMAVISHVPHLTAAGLMNLAAEHQHAGLLALAAGGFRDVTRVAASSPGIWLDICRENRDAIVAELGRYIEDLSELRDLVERRDAEALRERLTSARTARRSIGRKDAAADLYEVRFPVPDRPGVLAEVTTSIGNLGINIEDLQITHAVEGGRGTIHLTVAGEQEAARVAEALRSKGFEARGGRLG